MKILRIVFLLTNFSLAITYCFFPWSKLENFALGGDCLANAFKLLAQHIARSNHCRWHNLKCKTCFQISNSVESLVSLAPVFELKCQPQNSYGEVTVIFFLIPRFSCNSLRTTIWVSMFYRLMQYWFYFLNCFFSSLNCKKLTVCNGWG